MISAQVQEAAVSAGPWWGTALIAGAATMVGGLITVSVQSIIEWRKGKRANRIRWDQETYDLCLQVIANCELIAPRKVYNPKDLERARRESVHLDEMIETTRSIITRLEIAAPWQVSGRAMNLLNASIQSYQQPLADRQRGDKIDVLLHESYSDLINRLKSELQAPKGKKMKPVPHSPGSPSEFVVYPGPRSPG